MNYQLLAHIKETNAKYWPIKTYIIIFNNTLSLKKHYMHYFFMFFYSICPVTSAIQFRGVPAINNSHH
jgi:hypothetical protein